MNKMKTSYCLFIFCVLVLHYQAKAQSQPPLLGRPDGHEPGSQQIDPAEGDDSKPLLGRRDGHEPDNWQDNLEDTSYEDGDENYSYEEEELDTSVESETGNEEDPWTAEDDQEPLVRCRRLLCSEDCKEGYEVDASGCPTCQCKKPDSSRPDGPAPPADGCNRPMCLMYCANGFKIGNDGCPICECNNTEHFDNSDGSNPDTDCRGQPLCRMFCEFGFQTDLRGCPVCSCLENPCERIDCGPATVCQSQPCESRRSCTQLSAKCVHVQQSLPCPEPMCANACPDGYLKNEEGCMTCQCAPVPAERLCGAVTCEKGQICRNTTDSSVPKCSVKTLCEIQREQPVALGSTSLQCEANGVFKPLQCNPMQADCWCVDGLGQEVAGTRSTVYVDEHKPKCVRNITISMHIHLTFVVKHDITITNMMGFLNSTIVDHVSTWLLVEPHYITVVKANAMSSDERSHSSDDGDDYVDGDESYAYDSDDISDDLDSSRLLAVELVVLHDGQSDLPSAANYMRQRMHQGLCDIPVDKGSLLPNPYSLKTEHEFEQQLYEPLDVIYEPDRCDVVPDSWYCWRKRHIGICSIGTAVLVVTVLLIVSLSVIICRRRRMRTLAFKHQVLESQMSVDQSFLEDDSDKPLPLDGDNYPIKEEKLPIA